jgi:hypothetical protein
MSEHEYSNDVVTFIVAALNANWSLGAVDAAVARRWPALVGAELTAVYVRARDELRAGWVYAHRRRSGPISDRWSA